MNPDTHSLSLFCPSKRTFCSKVAAICKRLCESNLISHCFKTFFSILSTISLITLLHAFLKNEHVVRCNVVSAETLHKVHVVSGYRSGYLWFILARVANSRFVNLVRKVNSLAILKEI